MKKLVWLVMMGFGIWLVQNETSMAQYSITRGNKEIITTDSIFVDSLFANTNPKVNSRCASFSNYEVFGESDSQGKLMFCDANIVKLDSAGERYAATNIFYYENACVKCVSKYDMSQNIEEYCDRNVIMGDSCEMMWESGVSASVEGDSLLINSSFAVNVEIVEAYRLAEKCVEQFRTSGNNYRYKHNLAENTLYLIVIRNSSTNEIIKIVRAKK